LNVSAKPCAPRQCLLAYERAQGRTEEHYPAQRAQLEFEQLAGQLNLADLPRPYAAEFDGMRELREYLRLQEMSRALASGDALEPLQSAKPDATEVTPVAAQKVPEPELAVADDLAPDVPVPRRRRGR
jgi:hypothetical protein